MKKVLVIAYHFPPIGGSGMQRTVKFVKYLKSFGWQPVVLSVSKGKSYELVDTSLMDEVPKDVAVYRTPWFNPKGILKVPDRKIGWLPFAFFKGRSILRREGIDLIYTTSPTVTAHLIAYLLKKTARLPWVADFRDPWVGNPARMHMKGIRRKIETFLERKVVVHADQVIANTDALKADFEKRYPEVHHGKFVTITNGYDPEDFKGFDSSTTLRVNPEQAPSFRTGCVEWVDEQAPACRQAGPAASNGRFVITHTGEFYAHIRNPDNFLKAVGELIREGRIKKEDVMINFVGSGDYSQTEQYRCTVQANGLQGIIQDVNHVPHQECIRFLFSSSVLLLFAFSNGALQVPAKTYEYLRVGRPILALAEEGAASQLLKKIDSAIVADPNSIEAIKEAIYQFYIEYKDGTVRRSADEGIKEKFNRKSLTQSLAQTFDVLVTKRGDS